MRDLKYLGRKKKNIFQQHWKGILWTFLLLSVLIPTTVMLARKGAEAVSSWKESRRRPEMEQVQKLTLGDDLFAVASDLLPTAISNAGQFSATADDGTTLKLTINPKLQQQIRGYLKTTNPLYAIFVAVEPATGRVLSIVGHSSVDPEWGQTALYQIYPMASLFKMVTAAAALEKNLINPSTVLEYRGKVVSESPDNWTPHPRGRNQSIDVTSAMGKSVNPVYGIIASDMIGKESLNNICSRFGFNRRLLLPGIPAIPSYAPKAETTRDIRLQGCGLDHDLKVSPIHAAAITAAIANKGTMMVPRLVDQASRNGQQLEVPHFRELDRVISPETADSLTQMLLTTVVNGTSRKAFRSYNGQRLLDDIKIAAKTGSIDGDTPKGHYSWFAAFAPAEKPSIALVALVINGDKWKIKATHIGEQALTTFFSQDK